MLRVSQAVLEDTFYHLLSEAPGEGVGLWAGRQGLVERAVPLPNVHPTPRVAYHADPAALLRAVQGLEREGLELLAIYHSHPSGPAQPSPTDRGQAYWRVPYVIFALESGEVRAYNLPEGEEVRLHVEP
ncbi:MAG: metal-dependent protease of the PAD1/JAB1 superfamily [Meiothermus sp.]